MSDDELFGINSKYKIVSGSISLCDKNCVNQFVGLFGKNEQEVVFFYNLYFSRYHILHELGHIIRDYLKIECNFISKGASEEHIVNLFAVKYLQYIQDYEYLQSLEIMINHLLFLNNISVDFNISQMDKNFSELCKDIRLYGALQFSSIKNSMTNPIDFLSLVSLMTNNKITLINSSIVFSKKKTGSELISECLELVFGLVEKKPEINFELNSDISIQKAFKIS